MGSNSTAPPPQETVSVDIVRNLLHDLGGPLVAAQGFLSLLERMPDGPSSPRYLGALRESLDAMRELIEQTKGVCRKQGDP